MKSIFSIPIFRFKKISKREFIRDDFGAGGLKILIGLNHTNVWTWGGGQIFLGRPINNPECYSDRMEKIIQISTWGKTNSLMSPIQAK